MTRPEMVYQEENYHFMTLEGQWYEMVLTKRLTTAALLAVNEVKVGDKIIIFDYYRPACLDKPKPEPGKVFRKKYDGKRGRKIKTKRPKPKAAFTYSRTEVMVTSVCYYPPGNTMLRYLGAEGVYRCLPGITRMEDAMEIYHRHLDPGQVEEKGLLRVQFVRC